MATFVAITLVQLLKNIMFISFVAVTTALLLTITGTLTFWPVAQWFDFYRPIVLMLGGYVAGVIFMWIFYEICGHLLSSYKKQYNKPSRFARFLLHNGMNYVNRVCRVKLITVGLDNIPSEPFLLIGNHKSNFDPMLVAQALANRDIAFVCKKEVMKLPLAGHLMWRNCYLPIDRKDRTQSLTQFNRAAELIASRTTSIGVYPEGTRVNNGELLGEFHHGAFHIAIKTKCPIVIVTMKGTEKIHKNFPRKSHVQMICRVLYYREDYLGMNAKQLSDHIHSLIFQELSEK